VKLIQRSLLSDEVQHYIACNDDLDESFAVLNVATDYGAEYGEPMTLEAALEAVRKVAAQVEAL